MSSTAETSSRVAWVAKRSVFSSAVGSEIALLDNETNIYFTLNETGAFIWSVLQEPMTISELCAAVCGNFEVETGQCEVDVAKIVSQLIDAGLIDMKMNEDSPRSC